LTGIGPAVGAIGSGFGASAFHPFISQSRWERMGFEPERAGGGGRINVRRLPPDRFIAAAMHFAMMAAAERHGKFVADLAAQRCRSRDCASSPSMARGAPGHGDVAVHRRDHGRQADQAVRPTGIAKIYALATAETNNSKPNPNNIHGRGVCGASYWRCTASANRRMVSFEPSK
jgi:hypothetical protein